MQQIPILFATVFSLTAQRLSPHDFLGLFLYILYIFLEEYTHLLSNHCFN
jgi:hypothetical protein